MFPRHTEAPSVRPHFDWQPDEAIAHGEKREATECQRRQCSEQPVRLLSGDRTMASVPSKSSRSLKSRPCGWATSGPPRGTQIHHMYGEAVSRGVAGSGAQSLTCVPKRSASASPSDTGREGQRPPHGENPARPPAAGRAEALRHVARLYLYPAFSFWTGKSKASSKTPNITRVPRQTSSTAANSGESRPSPPPERTARRTLGTPGSAGPGRLVSFPGERAHSRSVWLLDGS